MCREADEAIRLISRELTWKVHFEKAQAQERAAEVAARGLHRTSNQSLKACRDHLLFDARNSLVRSLLSCPENLRWKILLAGSRLELGVGAVDTARTLLRRAFAEVPVKSRANVFLECSRLEEFVGNLDVARLVLARARSEVRSEWKVFLETVLLEARSGHIAAAVVAAREAVDVHPGTGRLWAMYIQLLNRVDEAGDAGALGTQRESSHQVVVRAITEVPKSGEVWCERARCLLNPLCVRSFDLSEAQRALSFAAQFTPQYGDTFIEYARLEMLCQVLLPQVLGLLRMPVQTFLQSRLSEDLDADLVDLLLVESEEGREDYWEDLQRVVGPVMDVPARNFDRPNRRQQMQDVLRLDHDFRNSPQDYATVALGSLHRR
jgi:la-related protein 1